MSHAVPKLSKLALSAVALLGLTAAAPAAAQWAWKDDNGRVVYSDRPPPSSIKADKIVRQPASSQTVLPPSASASSASAGDDSPKPAPATRTAGTPSTQKSTAEQEMEFRKRQQERADAEKKANEEQARNAAKASDCERSKGYLRALEEGQRVVRTDTAGNREYLDDAQRASELERARKLVQSSCG
jgi:uncharacterized protein DUF4124